MNYIKSFGYRLFFLNFLYKVFSKITKKGITVFLAERKHSLIKKRLSKDFDYIINKYKKISNIKNNNDTIWIFWWQGFDNAPEMVKKCIKSIKKYSEKVILLDKDNLYNYINIEQTIINKLDRGIITKTHFSDIVRMKLLSKYGGYWIDSTIFLTDNIFKLIENKDFYTPKLYEKDNLLSVSKGKWCGFFIGGKNNVLYSFVNDIFVEYWNKYDCLIDYFLIDYCISLAYDNLDIVRYDIDNNNYNNMNIFELNKIKNRKFDKERYTILVKNNMIHKLSYKDMSDNIDDNSFYKVVIDHE